MLNTEWIDMLRVLPQEQHNTVVLVLANRAEIAIDTIFRFEPNYLVLRGRTGGTTDEGRAFFIPYDQMVYYRIERVVNLTELQAIFESQSERTADAAPESSPAILAESPRTDAQTQATTAPTDATATRNALLDRIRAARGAPNNRP